MEKYWPVYVGVVDGFKIVDGDMPSYQCHNYNLILSENAKPKMDEIIRRELAEGCISVTSEKPKCLHALGVVPKGPNGIRPITDCSFPSGQSMNNFCGFLLSKFSYSTIQDAVKLLEPGYFMSVVDIKSAYRAVSITPEHRTYLGFEWTLDGKSEYYMDNRLCFGLTLGPCYFNSISIFIATILKKWLQVSVVQYLDDYLIVAPTKESAEASQWRVIKLLRFLGFYVSWSKVTDPSTETVYLGVTIDSHKMELHLPEPKVTKFKELVAKYVSAKWIMKNKLEQLNGVLCSLSHCAQIIQGGRNFARRCYDTYRHLILSHKDRIRISAGMKADLEWWARFAPSFNGVRLILFQHHDTPIWMPRCVASGRVLATNGFWEVGTLPLNIHWSCQLPACM